MSDKKIWKAVLSVVERKPKSLKELVLALEKQRGKNDSHQQVSTRSS